MAKKVKIEHGLVGVAGEYFVAAELSKRGYLATLTQRNTRGIDILASNADATKSAAIQVKTCQNKNSHWPLSQKSETLHSPRLFYILVNLDTESGSPEYHVVPSKVVATEIKRGHKEWLSSPGKNGHVRKDSPLRKFAIKNSEFLNRWDLLDLD